MLRVHLVGKRSVVRLKFPVGPGQHPVGFIGDRSPILKLLRIKNIHGTSVNLEQTIGSRYIAVF